MTTLHERILILDFGSQYTQLIARKIREMGVYCEIHPFSLNHDEIKAFAPKGIILSGGPDSVTEEAYFKAPDLIFEMGCPLLGICYGMQIMAAQMGGSVAKACTREYGYKKVSLKNVSKLFQDIEDAPRELEVWMSHGDHVNVLPQDFQLIGSTDTCEIVAMAHEEKKFYGLQFHPEVSHTKQGTRILKRFVLEICGCNPTWTTQNIIQSSFDRIKEQVKKDKVILGLSGGVDSSVVAALLHKSIGDQLTCVFVDNGLLRLHEAEEVQKLFGKHLGIPLITIDAKDRFYAALEGIEDPETKRKIVGKLFIDVFNEVAQILPDVKWLAQGTIYPDVIESAASKSGNAQVIKSHHNVGGLPSNMQLNLIEPLRELFKDEVRKIGLELGLPYDLIYRHPFPGPGLAVRILGEVKLEYAEILREADAILIEELRKHNYYYQCGQAFAVFLPIKSVGVIGDARQYEYVVAIRIIESIDFMTAHVARLPQEFLENVANRIINEVRGISRVVYDISGKPPATIEWE